MAKSKTKITQAPTEKILSPQHLKDLECHSRDVLNAKLAMALEEQSLKNMILQYELLQRDIAKQKELVQVKAQAFEIEKKKYKTVRDDVFAVYEIADNAALAYDTSSGKIITEEKQHGGN